MAGSNYSVIPNDWTNLALIISDLSRIINEDASFTDYLLKDGSRALTANWDAGAFQITAANFVSDVADGTAPFSATSTTVCPNLNASFLEGHNAAYFQAAGSYQPLATNLTSLSGLTFASTSFVKMTAAGTFGLDTNVYYKSGDSPSFVRATITEPTLSPFVITSNVVNTNLNADLWDGYQFADYLDQAVKVASTPQFAYIGIGAAVNPNYAINATLSKASSSSTIAGIFGEAVNTYYSGFIGSSIGAVQGLNFAVRYTPAGNLSKSRTMPLLQAVNPVMTVTSYANEANDITITEATAFGSFLAPTFTRGAGSSGALTVTNFYNFKTKSATLVNGAMIGTQYGFYDGGLSGGGINWGLAINTQSYINGKIRINGGAVVPTDALEVVGITNLGDGGATNYAEFLENGNLSFKGTAGFYPRVLSQADEPASGVGDTQLDNGESCFWIDTDDSTLWLCYNQAGTVKTIQLT